MRDVGAQDLFERHAGLQRATDFAQHRAVRSVAHDQDVVAIEQGEAVRQPFERARQPALRQVGARIGFHEVRDVASAAAIAGEAPGRVEHRFTRDRQMPRPSLRVDALHAEIAEWLARIELSQVLRPLRVAHPQRPRFAARLADEGFRRQAGLVVNTGRQEGEPQIGILFPEPVGARLGEILEALFGLLEDGCVGQQRDEAAAGHRRAAQLDITARRAPARRTAMLGPRGFHQAALDLGDRVLEAQQARRRLPHQDLAQMHARRAQRVRHAHQFAIACVAGDEAEIGAPDADAFAHVLQRRLQQVALLAQFAFLRLEFGDLGGDDRRAAVAQLVFADLDPGAVEDLALQHRLGIAMMLHAPADEAFDIRAGVGIAPGCETGAQQAFERGAGNQQILDRIGNAAIGVVAGDEPVIGVEQRERVGQAADGRGELLLRLVGAFFRLDRVGDVAAGAAIAGHVAFGVDNRTTADGEVVELAVVIAPRDAHVAIGAPRLEQLDMLGPLGRTKFSGTFSNIVRPIISSGRRPTASKIDGDT